MSCRQRSSARRTSQPPRALMAACGLSPSIYRGNDVRSGRRAALDERRVEQLHPRRGRRADCRRLSGAGFRWPHSGRRADRLRLIVVGRDGDGVGAGIQRDRPLCRAIGSGGADRPEGRAHLCRRQHRPDGSARLGVGAARSCLADRLPRSELPARACPRRRSDPHRRYIGPALVGRVGLQRAPRTVRGRRAGVGRARVARWHAGDARRRRSA